MGSPEERYEWRYLRSGKRTHALVPPVGRECAECGMGPALFDDWHGTGTQAEYERAASLPKCRRCLTAIGAGNG